MQNNGKSKALMPTDNTINSRALSPLILTMRELTQLFSEEITILKERRPKEIEKFLPLKNQLMASYDNEMAELSARGGLQACGNGQAIRELKKISRIFQSVLTHHNRLTGSLKKISENMIKAIGDEVVKSQNQTSHYGSNGVKSTQKSPTSISLNQTI